MHKQREVNRLNAHLPILLLYEQPLLQQDVPPPLPLFVSVLQAPAWFFSRFRSHILLRIKSNS